MRRRIITSEKVIRVLAELFNVTYYIARKYYFKANEKIEEAKVYLKLHTMKLSNI